MRGRARGYALYVCMAVGALVGVALFIAFNTVLAEATIYLGLIAGTVVGALIWARAKPEDDQPDPAMVERRVSEFRDAIDSKRDSDRWLAKGLRSAGMLGENEVLLGRWKGSAVDWKSPAWLVVTNRRVFYVPFRGNGNKIAHGSMTWEMTLAEASDPRKTDFRFNPPRHTLNFEVGGQSVLLNTFSTQEACEAILAARRLASSGMANAPPRPTA
jgi:hypothetical protein